MRAHLEAPPPIPSPPARAGASAAAPSLFPRTRAGIRRLLRRPRRARRNDAAGLQLLLLAALVLAPASGTAADPDGEAIDESPPPAASQAGASSRMPELAAGTAVQIHAVLGFSGVHRLGTWAPLTVTLENRRAPVSGHLEVQVPDGDELGGRAFLNIHRRAVDLPGASRKRFHFTVYLKSFSEPLEIRLLAGGRELAATTMDLRSGVTNARMILVLGRDADLDYLNDPRGRRLRVLYPRVERLPEHWAGYDGAAALVLHGLSLESLGTRQYAALTKWLASGGVLAVSGGPDYGLLRTLRLALLLPGLPRGLVDLPEGRVVGSSFGAPLSARRPFNVNFVPHFEGRVLHRAGDTPLVIERPFGRGRVLYLTFDISRPPFDASPGMAALWYRLLDLPPPESLSARLTRREASSALPGLIRNAPLSFPGHPLLLVFVLLYLGCIAAAFHLRREGGRSRRAAIGLHGTAPPLFALGAFLLFGALLFPPGPVAVVAARIAPHPEGPLADLELEVGMFASADLPLRFDYHAPEPVFRPAARNAPARAGAHWRHGVAAFGGSLEPLTRGRYVLHAIDGRDIIAWDLHAAALDLRDEVRLEVRNHSGRALHDVWLVLDGQGYALDSLPAGADSTRIFDPQHDAVPLREHSWRRLLAAGAPSPRSEAKAGMIERELARLHERGAPAPPEAILLGFSESPLRLAPASAAWPRHELALVLLRVRVERRGQDAGGFRS